MLIILLLRSLSKIVIFNAVITLKVKELVSKNMGRSKYDLEEEL